MPGYGCWRCTPTRSLRRVTGSAPRAANRIDLTGSCSASSRAPMRIVSGPWSRTLMKPRRCERSLAGVRISSPHGWRWATRCARSLNGSGPARCGCFPRSTPQSAWRFLRNTTAHRTREVSVPSAWRRFSGLTDRPRPTLPTSCWPSYVRLRQVAPGMLRPGGDGRLCSRSSGPCR
jgi:hypothetical protein